jgi:hypothetical protein
MPKNKLETPEVQQIELESNILEIPEKAEVHIKLKVLASVFTDKELHAYNEDIAEWQDAKERAKNLNIAPPDKPRLKEPEFIYKWFNMSSYVVDQWIATYDKKLGCDLIIADFTHAASSQIEVINANYTEQEWIGILTTLGYVLLQKAEPDESGDTN